MNKIVSINNKEFNVTYSIVTDSDNEIQKYKFIVRNKENNRKFNFSKLYTFKDISQKRAEKVVKELFKTMPINRAQNLLSYKSVASTKGFITKIK